MINDARIRIYMSRGSKNDRVYSAGIMIYYDGNARALCNNVQCRIYRASAAENFPETFRSQKRTRWRPLTTTCPSSYRMTRRRSGPPGQTACWPSPGVLFIRAKFPKPRDVVRAAYTRVVGPGETCRLYRHDRRAELPNGRLRDTAPVQPYGRLRETTLRC